MAAPPLTLIRELEHASLQLEKEDAANNPEYAKWLSMLIVPGSSLGGARPKASVLDDKGNLWIAKFPSANDTKNTGLGKWFYIIWQNHVVFRYRKQKFSNSQVSTTHSYLNVLTGKISDAFTLPLQ